MAKTRAVIYGMSTEGFNAARSMALAGADVHIIDESTPSSVPLSAEVAKTYPDVASLIEDEPLLALEPVEEAIAGAQYVFFAPRIRKASQDTKPEIRAKLKDASSAMSQGSSFVYCIPTGIGGNNENISLLEHVTGHEVGKAMSYFYCPLAEGGAHPSYFGSYSARADARLARLLSHAGGDARQVTLGSAEHFHTTRVLDKFARMSCMLEVFRYAQDERTRSDLAGEDLRGMFLHDMLADFYDLRAISSSFEGPTTLSYIVNGGIKGVEGYVKRLIGEIRTALKKNELKASRTRIALSWTYDRHEMRGDRADMLRYLTTKLRDYIGDVETLPEAGTGLFHNDKTVIIVACSAGDYDRVESDRNGGTMVIKANPLCEIVR